MDEAHSAPSILTLADGATIAYHRTPGKAPGVVFLHGFRSDMTGDKALTVENWCKTKGHACVRFDQRGHGRSSGRFEEGTIGQWAADTVAVLAALTEGPQILVGSSMGGWLMLLAALAGPARIAGLLGIAAAPDFTEDLIAAQLGETERARLEAEGVLPMPGPVGEPPIPLTRALIADGRRHLLLRGPIALSCPVRLLHGREDDSVPWETALRLQERLSGPDVRVTLIKDGGHRLSRPEDLALIARELEALAQDQTTP
ncbi:alpha/beta hydrolase [Pararhodospirillum oryzae]|uniref:Palmitoyl-protein thioesterase ABHD10, mitochondrial n=2 Tax=Pararhodospirillum oryzae TaxID=478448 RepID=A0A512H6E2_9PROT|nr:alpha/beta hydrolase [Pararhodospirillum oryzae]